ncbi:similar to Saccharomyces cerevisiae YOR367W SCP1 Component of yeast cortical actin cytoskeleton, binds and cross links actin filaments [Maudiozyma saulgeensis]|uniref:Similar to Saccharomyces cerevisiae YOR367W SCP1 Component of yeast cortical actin cytoskeleton, binds and cross links actin filaments n=1 Tax=Maudiozyma saulgeensis TaxID=1789683 RepID=A0A1X7R633_9SACH|nr:similar to Saccharomyces cerevisiae YOR367W SCP1 Component of yeast cortical actin cytoskeleton, binds and cross links actin filaments [Kazachstania saulgeensis]
MSYDIKPDVTSLDEDLRLLREGKFDQNSINSIQGWIYTSVLKENIPNENLLDSLKSGVTLCKLANTLSQADIGSSIIKWKESKMPFVQMEQISQFLTFLRQYGVPEDELFQTVDLYEEKDPASVYQALKSLSRYANKRHPDLFPVLGPQIATKKPRPPVKQKPKHLKGESGWSTVEYGYMKGASQGSEGIVFGQRRNIL